ncbi:C69 family dipeptidase [Apilactobacillus apisilvae]|uniref:Dipeptidase n=1 Tax=Apilactobacillus apisilvae TaxID=2923364 RepID=A0ABY4PIL7_9LACO|nr:C69 family dipeptidase [Apilactobacillus apisilvae]UQS85350.1 C69 family dipeptidase [Apilactobacillus apisilvae]
MSEYPNYSACTSILVGKKASIDGSTMIGRNEDSKATWPKHFVVNLRKEFKSKQKFISKDNNFEMNLPKISYKYTSTPEWTDKYGKFEEDGINEYNVAMSATESAYANENVLGYDPLVKDGIGEEAMVTVVLPYIKSAREGVKRLGKIISKHGTCESNGILFSDKDEIWYLETGSGHHWVAMRIPDDCYAVVSNQISIRNINFDDSNNFMWSKGIREFVNNNKLNPEQNGSFNFRHIFGTKNLTDVYYNNPRVWYGQKMFNPDIKQNPESHDMPFIRKPQYLISVNDAQKFLASHYQGTPYDPIGSGSKEDKTKYRPISLAKTQEAHVLQIRPNLPDKISGIHWLAMGVAAQSVFVPFFAGIEDTLSEYKNGNLNYSPKSAYWIFKLVGVLLDPHYLELNDTVKNIQENLNIKFKQFIINVDKQYNKEKDINKYLTDMSNKNAKDAINEYQELAYNLIANSTDFSKLNYKQDLNL